MKRGFIILSLIISFLSLVYLTLSYYGMIRYYKLHGNTDYYKFFSKLPSLKDERIVVSFSVKKEDELSNLLPFLNSILHQSVRVNEIAMNLPYSLQSKIPDNIKKIVSVYGYSKDYEKCSSFIPTILREPDSNTKIIIVSPDIVYDYNFIVDIVDYSNEYKNNIIVAQKGEEYGVLVKPSFFDTKISEYNRENKSCLEWCGICSKNKIKFVSLENNYKK